MSKASASALWLRFSESDKERIRKVAKAVGLSMDSYARAAVMSAVRVDEQMFAHIIAIQETQQDDESRSAAERQ